MGDQTDWCCKHVAINQRGDLPFSVMQPPQVSSAMQGGGFAACALGLLCVFQEKLVRFLARCCGRSLFGGRKTSRTNHSSSSVVMLQIYVPRLPGLPDGFSYLPNKFGLQYEVRRAWQQFLGSLCLLALQNSNSAAGAGDRSTCPFLCPARLQALMPAPAQSAILDTSEGRP